MLRRCLRKCCQAITRDVEEFDALVVGGGPAGLAAAIRLKQLAAGNENFRVALVEKGSELGAHTLSGACIETKALEEFLPNWKEEGAPIKQKCTSDTFYTLTETKQYKTPSIFLPSMLDNHHNYIVSLGEVVKWMGTKAEEMGVEIFCGFAGSELVFNEDKTQVHGVQLNDVGISKSGEQTEGFTPGMTLKAKQTLFAEGCRGSLTKQLESHFNLRAPGQHQSYGLGVKEVWEIKPEKFDAGAIMHTVGWPMVRSEGHDNTYGGSFMYHYGDNLLSCGFVVGLDYKSPFIRPYMEFQKWKTHPFVRTFFEGGKPLMYGARTLVEGGLSSLPKLHFPGGMLIGDCAGFLNLPKIKGTHGAMKSATLASEALFADLYGNPAAPPDYGKQVTSYEDAFKKSWLYKELHMVRNVRQMFAMNFYAGMAYTGMTAMITKGMEPWTLKHKHGDHETLVLADKVMPIKYPKPDNVLTFDILTNHSRSGTTHNGDQPIHLKLKSADVPTKVNLLQFNGPEGRYCPAKVYEFVEKDGETVLVINAQNCLHCKACDIKDPTQNINWTCPEGSGGPNYNSQM